jgi:hypothetical protein
LTNSAILFPGLSCFLSSAPSGNLLLLQNGKNKTPKHSLLKSKLGDSAVCEQHEFLDEFVGGLLHVLADRHGLARRGVQFERQLHALQLHRTAVLKPQLAQNVTNSVQIDNRLSRKGYKK